ncbi:Possible hydrolase or acyltransferase RutD in novel pyrimidine catabolism pathway [Klebsiella pneumoniae IS22]|nr:Possible hydrolase or acyltransferase RutD in novel pyrimidine catabolism pathway [Klebsiella pneumoniae IS22]
MMRLNIAPAPWPGAPVVVLSAGLGGGGGYWLAQRAALEEQYQLVSYDHNGTGENAGPLPAGYSLATMAGELFSALQAAGIARFALVGHALGALIGLQLALDRPEAVSALALVNGCCRCRRIPAAASRCASVCCMPAARRRGSKRSRYFSTRRNGWPRACRASKRKMRLPSAIFRAKRIC